MKKKEKNIFLSFLILACSIIISCYIVEIFLWVIQKKPEFSKVSLEEIAAKNGKHFDERSKLDIIMDLRKEGIDAWPTIFPSIFAETNGVPSSDSDILPLSGLSNKTVVSCNESGEFGVLETDEYGFNNPKGLHRKNITEVVLLGDSFTFGECVKSGEDIAGSLRDMKINSLNLGGAGNGPLIELAILKEYTEPIRPDIVLWVYFEGNDIMNLENERKSSTLMRYLKNDYSQNLTGRQIDIDRILMDFINSEMQKNLKSKKPQKYKEKKQRAGKPNNSLSILKLKNLRHRLGLIKKIKSNAESTQLPLFIQILKAANQRVTAWGGELYLVYLPDLRRYINNNNKGSYHQRDKVIDAVHELGIRLIDFHEIINNHPNPEQLSYYPFSAGRHYNADGYKLVAEQIASHLRKDSVIDKDQ